MEVITNFWQQVQSIFAQTFLGVPIGKYVAALFTIVIIWIIGKAAVILVLRLIKKFSAKSQSDFNRTIYDALKRPLNFLVWVVVLYFLKEQLDLKGIYSTFFNNFLHSLMVVCFFWFLLSLVRPFDFLFRRWEQYFSKAMVDWIIKFFKIFLVFIELATVLDIWSIKIGPIIAGLGLFSVALALGAQDLFKNLIAGIVILIERRFVIGDRVAAGNVDGNVEKIGFRSTYIRRLDKTPVIVPNTVFSDQPIINYTGMDNRRIEWTIGLTYSTTADQLKAIISDIREYVKGAKEFVHRKNTDYVVYADSFGDSSINILIQVLTRTTEYDQYMKDKEGFLYKLMEIVEKHGSSFAFPSQSLYIESIPKGATIYPGKVNTKEGE